MINTNITVFENKKVRRVWDEIRGTWIFSVIDIIEAIVETRRARKYWNDLKNRVIKEGFLELSAKIGQLKMIAEDGKLRETDVVDLQTVFRLIQSIPSSRAEPFKQWLAQVGQERIEEIQARNSKKFKELAKDAMEGGQVAGNARKEIEQKTGKKVLGKTNFLNNKQSPKKLKKII